MRRKKPDLFVLLVVFVALGVVMTTRAKSEDTSLETVGTTIVWPVLRKDVYSSSDAIRTEPVRHNHFNPPRIAQHGLLYSALYNTFGKRTERAKLKFKFRLAYQGAALNLKVLDSDFKFTIRRASRGPDRSEPFTQLGVEYNW